MYSFLTYHILYNWNLGYNKKTIFVVKKTWVWTVLVSKISTWMSFGPVIYLSENNLSWASVLREYTKSTQ